MKNATGDSAFPTCVSADQDGGLNYGKPGMTLRDWFAGMALSGMMSGGWVPYSEKDTAERLYRIADAMIAERNNP
jgi:hypothetical protein